MAGRMYRQTRHGTWPRLGLGLGLEFAHGRACASLLTFLYTRPAVCITSAQQLSDSCCFDPSIRDEKHQL